MRETDFYLFLGEKISSLRSSKNLKQEELAELLNMSRPSVVNIEKGRQKPSIYMIQLIADYFDVDINSLLPRALEQPLSKMHTISDRKSLLENDSINKFYELVISGK